MTHVLLLLSFCCCCFQGKLDKALPLYEKALAIDINIYDRNVHGHPDHTDDFLYKAMERHLERERKKNAQAAVLSARNAKTAGGGNPALPVTGAESADKQVTKLENKLKDAEAPESDGGRGG